MKSHVLAGYRLADELHKVLKEVGQHGVQNGSPDAPHFVPEPKGRAAHAQDPNQPAASGKRVWVNTRSGVYWPEGSEYYGHTKQGQYMSENDAKAKGYRPGLGE